MGGTPITLNPVAPAVNFEFSSSTIALDTNNGNTVTVGDGGGGNTVTVGDGTGLLSNYNVTLIPGTLTVHPCPLSYTIGDDSQTYGSAELGPGSSGHDRRSQRRDAGHRLQQQRRPGDGQRRQYPISGTLSNGTGLASNYNVSLTNGALTVNQAPLTATADDLSKNYGDANPPLTATITGFLNGDTATRSVSGTPAFSTTATTDSGLGVYPIVPALGTLAATNYTFTFVSGTLTIVPAPQAVSNTPNAETISKVFAPGENSPPLETADASASAAVLQPAQGATPSLCRWCNTLPIPPLVPACRARQRCTICKSRPSARSSASARACRCRHLRDPGSRSISDPELSNHSVQSPFVCAEQHVCDRRNHYVVTFSNSSPVSVSDLSGTVFTITDFADVLLSVVTLSARGRTPPSATTCSATC